MHEHNHCVHDSLKHCGRCDVVWCLDCKKEWRVQPTPYTITTWPERDISIAGSTIDCGTVGLSDNTTIFTDGATGTTHTLCSHA